MFRPRFLGVLLCSIFLAAPVASCDKSGRDTTLPGGDGAAPQAGPGPAMRYRAEARTLKQTTAYEVQMSGGGQFGQAKLQVGGTVTLSPMDGDKVKVAWKMNAVDSLELEGEFQPKAKDGKPNPLPDPKATLLERGAGVFVVDLRGEEDSEASDALPENQAKKNEREELQKKIEEAAADSGKKGGGKKGGGKKGKATPAAAAGGGLSDELRTAAAAAQFVALFEGIFQVPSLPQPRLEEGKPLTVAEEGELPMGDTGITLPFESETIYTLIKIDDSSGKRIAEIEVELEGSGAAEMEGGMFVVDQSTEATILFNLDDGVPVRVTSTSTQAYSWGENGQEITTMRQTEYEVQ